VLMERQWQQQQRLKQQQKEKQKRARAQASASSNSAGVDVAAFATSLTTARRTALGSTSTARSLPAQLPSDSDLAADHLASLFDAL